MFETLNQYFEPVESLSADEARAYIGDQREGSFTLLDVRQPKEYERGHIPGAKLIPVPALSESVGQLDPDKPVLVY